MALNALDPDLELSEDRERDLRPDNDPISVSRLLKLADGQIVCVYSACPEGSETRAYVLDPSGGQVAVPELKDQDKIWSAGDDLLVLRDDEIHLVRLDGTSSQLVSLPEGTNAVDTAWTDGGVRVAAIVTGERVDDPVLFPTEREKDTLWTYGPRSGWKELTPIPAGCWSLSLSADGSHCVWRVSVNTVPEEAMRGEFWVCKLETGKMTELTSGAGKTFTCIAAHDGSGVVYEANFEKNRPITTHTNLWWHAWEDEPVCLTGDGRNVVDFGWLDARTLWVSFIDGVERITEAVELNGDSRLLSVPALGECVTSDQDVWCESSDKDKLPYLALGSRVSDIPWKEEVDDLHVRVVDWKASDGLEIQGVVYEASGTLDGAPLLVRAHGGPAGDVEASRGAAIRYRYLLRAGYRVFEPAFRGSLGFGDSFLGANIGCQGVKDLDDIVTGIDRLAEMDIADTQRVGIYGGSYGGYMTLRAVAVTDRFRTGVAYYGFIENRRMTLETGDFTYEDEYIAPVTWPMRDDAVNSDVFSHLHEINCPLMMMHGDQDPICTLSQSKIVYRALEHRGIQTGLVVYPGEGHGFRKPEHRQDCARRTLAWFEEFLPV